MLCTADYIRIENTMNGGVYRGLYVMVDHTFTHVYMVCVRAHEHDELKNTQSEDLSVTKDRQGPHTHADSVCHYLIKSDGDVL